ncbi:MAG: selenocysteine-specific translation elongation factor [Acidimicrobiales bacterium]|nr:selenocysteine-specific translation elongation factor [Acidimicrobiales bacterium]
MHVIATAGHVDHGKSTLVLALTGTDPDRFAEEKARGLTIDLGFASTSLPSGRGVAIIDVPGHIRFLKNMLAGVGAVDACLFVVAATEGWKPQSEEHLRILSLLGVRQGIVALTKVGMADTDLIELAKLDIAEQVAGTFLEDAPIVEVDAIDGVGIDDLRAGLDVLLDATPEAVDEKRPRLWIDRSFSAKGAGTVVTGTLGGGRIRVDDELTLLPHDRTVRIRGLQSLYADRTKVGPGNRVAINLSGIGHDELGRGDVLVAPGQWHRTDRFDAELTVLDDLDHEVSRRGAHLVYLGSGEHPVRLRVLGPEAIAPGQTGFVRVFLPTALPLTPGDRFIVRDAGRAETVGGGEILDIDPQVKAADAVPDRSVERVIAERGWVEADHLFLLTGERRTPTVGPWVVDPAALEATLERLATLVAEAGPLGLDLAGLDDRDRLAIELVDNVVVDGSHAKIADQVDTLAEHPYLAELIANPFTPPDPDGVDRGELRELVRRGQVVAEDGVFFAATAIEAAGRRMAELLRDQPEGITVSEFRTALGCTRKHALPLLAILDGTGQTRRRDNVRIAGPRLPELRNRLSD